ncbi:MAG: hypothetical protein JNG89_05360 [Planctomycetaceae bacterium]|nr:hypothetical protein [Planctomycetaceae bacterium]
MYVTSAFVLVLGGLFAGATTDSAGQTFDSYTKAYHAAAEGKRPMLVILNPPADQVAADNAIDVDKLREDLDISKLLDSYVVAEIDTGTDHGRKVHELFGSTQLPRVVVIDNEQKNQIYRTSDHLETVKLKEVLETYQDGTPTAVSTNLNWARQYVQPGNCPNCRRYQQYQQYQ